MFPLVSPILTGLDRRGRSERGSAWDQQVASAILGFGASYGSGNLLQANRKLIDYGDLATQTAYVFMYVAGHADFLFQVLMRAQEQVGAPLSDKPEMRITSLGGGPGSDLFALVRLIRMLSPENRPRRIVYRVLDKQPNWHEILRTVADLQQGTIEIEVKFEALDVTVPEQWQATNCAEDDMFIMNFFISEVCRLRQATSVRQCLEHLLRSLPSNAAVIYNDSAAYTFYTYFDDLVSRVGGLTRIVHESCRLDASTDFDEFFKECMVRFGRTPKLGSNAAYRVLRRQ
jgi:hypothetical protein